MLIGQVKQFVVQLGDQLMNLKNSLTIYVSIMVKMKFSLKIVGLLKMLEQAQKQGGAILSMIIMNNECYQDFR